MANDVTIVVVVENVGVKVLDVGLGAGRSPPSR